MATYTNKPWLLGYDNGTSASNSNTGGAAGHSLGLAQRGGAGSTIIYQDGRWRFRRGDTGATSSARFDTAVAASMSYSAEIMFDMPTTDVASGRMIVMGNTGSNYSAIVVVNSSRQIELWNGANQRIYTGPAPLPVGRFRVHVGAEVGSTTANGRLRLNVYTADNGRGTTPDYSYSSDAANAGTDEITLIQAGHVNSNNESHDLYLVNWQADPGTIDPIGPLEDETAPLPNVAVDFGPYAIIDARASVSGGGDLVYTISPSGPEEIASGVWAAIRSEFDVEYTVTVTDASSSLSSQAAAYVAFFNVYC